ncbi:rubrerythrin family protein [Methanosarcina sp. DH2]|jgi:rubrerythrin|uniref:rubrerythrin family protein n=1 Tax=Methanosarcina sp. DH2 TaxID=2605639 RepID=UPI001E51AB61|nr:rubrerythrin family protein [Methanosarcina sp. DH2]MCC4770183.1 rubrerythrin family protein [Methanosarcina sp. DH2]
MNSKDNLKAAFTGESMANRTYLAFAKKADEEGYHQIAKLFRAAAAAETVHAFNHLQRMGGIGTTMDNLKDAIEGETYEFMTMYPEFIEEAKKEGDNRALWSFEVANKVERIHAGLYEKALNEIGNNKEVDYHVCSVCGHTIEGEPEGKCPICGAPASKFNKID